MNRDAASIITFTCAVAAAFLAAAIMSSSALADETFGARRKAADLDNATVSANALKRDYVLCERLATSAPLDMAVPALCAALYEELRTRVFEGNLDALLAWFRVAWNEAAPARQ